MRCEVRMENISRKMMSKSEASYPNLRFFSGHIIKKVICEVRMENISKIAGLGWCLILLLQTKVPALKQDTQIKQLFYSD